jgi:hypothetical protein
MCWVGFRRYSHARDLEASGSASLTFHVGWMQSEVSEPRIAFPW